MGTNAPPVGSVILDGITVQHAGELLFDSTSTAETRATCWQTYVRCLEDFSFAVVCGSHFALSSSLSSVGHDSPGNLVITTFNEFFSPVGRPDGIQPADLLNINSFRQRIAADLRNLDLAYEAGRTFWHDWIIREAGVYLGKHDSVYRSLPPDQYVFAIDPPYFVHRQLQDEIPHNFKQSLADVVMSYPNMNRVAKTALLEFVSRNALTLQTIFWWYEKVAATQSWRLPHINRAVVRLVTAEQEGVTAAKVARTLVARHILAYALESVVDRHELRENLIALRNQTKFKKIRDLFVELAVESDDPAKFAKKSNKILKDIYRLSSASNASAHEVVKLEVQPLSQVPLKVGGTITTKTFDRLADELVPRRRALRQVIVPLQMRDYMTRLNRVFPELQPRA